MTDYTGDGQSLDKSLKIKGKYKCLTSLFTINIQCAALIFMHSSIIFTTFLFQGPGVVGGWSPSQLPWDKRPGTLPGYHSITAQSLPRKFKHRSNYFLRTHDFIGIHRYWLSSWCPVVCMNETHTGQSLCKQHCVVRGWFPDDRSSWSQLAQLSVSFNSSGDFW